MNESEKRIVSDLIDLALEMGHTVRSLDDGGNSEHWTNDGEYIHDPRYDAACALVGRQHSDPL